MISAKARESFGKRHPKALIIITLAAFIALAESAGFAYYWVKNNKSRFETADTRKATVPPAPQLRRSEYAVEHGDAVRPEELHSHGQLYFVPVGAQAIPVQSLADYYHEKFATDITVLPQVAIHPEDCVPSRRQCIAEELTAEMTTAYPEIARNPDSVMIALTDEDIFPLALGWDFTYSLHSARFGIVSTRRMDPGFWQGEHDEAMRLASTKQMLTKYVAMLYYHVPASFDPTSVMYSPLTPDGSSDDLHESDLHAEATFNGRRGDSTPCLNFVYSYRTHEVTATDPGVTDCRNTNVAHTDEETFELNLGLGRITERSLDLQLDSTPPIEFRRGYISDYLHPMAMGYGTNHTFNTFLSSDGASALTYMGVVHEDGVMDYLNRLTPGRGFSQSVVFESREDGMRGARISWEAGYFKLQYRDGASQKFLPCNDGRCYLVGYQDSKGNSLRLPRSPRLGLQNVMAEGDQGIEFQSDDQVRITEAKATDGRTVEYQYGPDGCLASVHRADGQTVLYAYDAAHHMTSVSVVRERGAQPEEVAAFEYDRAGHVTKQTLAGVGSYQIEYRAFSGGYASVLRLTDPQGQISTIAMGSDEYLVRGPSVRFPRVMAHR